MNFRPIERAVQKDGVWGVTDRTIFPAGVWNTCARIPHSNLFLFAQDGKLGIADSSGKAIHRCVFEAVNLFFDHSWDHWAGDRVGYYDDRSVAAAAVCSDGRWGFISRKDGHWISLCLWDEADPFRQGLSRVCSGNKWGAIGPDGQLVIPLLWDELSEIRPYHGIRARQGSQWYVIDKTGQIVNSCRFEYMGTFFDGMAPVRVNGKWGCVDAKGQLHPPWKYHGLDGTYLFQYGLSKIKWKGKMGIIDRDGNEVVPPEWLDVRILSKDMLRTFNGLIGLVRLDGTQIYPNQLNWVYKFIGGMAIANQERKWGIIDENGNVLLDFRWDYVTDFRKFDRALVRLDGKWGVVDRAGNMVHPCSLDYWEADAIRRRKE